MGGAVSSGRDNNELIDNLMGGKYIRTRPVERVFRALDRADYMTPESRDQAYKDLAWRNGALHMSSPCIYSEVMECLELRPGLSFLNVGSGTGYLSTLVGLILGSTGISHGIEVHSSVVDYAERKLSLFLANSPTLDEFDFCEPKFYVGNGLCLPPQQAPYDRVYCGAGCPREYESYFKQLVKVGGVLVMPVNETLTQMRRVGVRRWVTRSKLTVSFAALRVPLKEEQLDFVKLEEQAPPRLDVMARGVIRTCIRRGVLRRHPELCEPAPRPMPSASCPRRICIPIESGGTVGGLDILHDLDAATGANEMNALLSLVIRMDQGEPPQPERIDGTDEAESVEEARPRRNAPEARPRRNAPEAPRRRPPSNADSPREGDSTDTARDPGSTSSNRKSPRNHGSSAGTSGRGGGSKDRPGRKSDRPSSESRRARKGDDDNSGTDKPRRVGPAARLWAFEFQAADRGTKGKNGAIVSMSTDTLATPSQPSDDGESSKAHRCKCVERPSEVEISFGDANLESLMPGPSGATMEWEESKTDTDESKESSSEEQDDGGETNSKPKRQKLDSGVGESPAASGSTPDMSNSDGSETDDRAPDRLTEQAFPITDAGGIPRRCVHVRTRFATRELCSAMENICPGQAEAAVEEAAEVPAAGCGARMRVPRRGRGLDARRVRLSVAMKRAVKELPLPSPLKKFVNYRRCFEF